MTNTETRLLFLKLEEIQSQLAEIKISSGWTDLKGAMNYSSCSRSTLLRGIHSGTLKHTKKQGKIRLKISWLDSWLMFGHSKRLNMSERARLGA